MCRFVYLLHLPIYVPSPSKGYLCMLFIYPCIHLSTYLPIHLLIYTIYPSFYLSTHPSIQSHDFFCHPFAYTNQCLALESGTKPLNGKHPCYRHAARVDMCVSQNYWIDSRIELSTVTMFPNFFVTTIGN